MPRIRIIGNLPIAYWGQTTLTSTLPPEEDFGITPEQQEYFNKIGARVVQNQKRGLYDVTSKDRTYGKYNPRGVYEPPLTYADTSKPKLYSKQQNYIGPQYYSNIYGGLNRAFNTGVAGYSGKGMIGPTTAFYNSRTKLKPKTSKQILEEWKQPDFYQESPYDEMMRKQKNPSPIQSTFDIQNQQDLKNMYDRQDYSTYVKHGGSIPLADFGYNVNTTTTLDPGLATTTTSTTIAPVTTNTTVTPTTTKPPLTMPQMTNPFQALGQQLKGTAFQKGVSKFANTKFMKGLGSGVDTLNAGVAIAAPFVDFFNERNIQKDINRQAQENSIAANLYETRPAGQTGNRGDWDINNGIFRADEIGFKSKGQYVNPMYYPSDMMGYRVKHGGAIDEGRKIRIKIIEDGNLDHMAAGGQISGYRGGYSGQYGYGLNLNQKKVYTDMPENKSEQYSNTLQPVDREKANIEAEKHEVAWGDVDADGTVEAMSIGGKRHEQGGTPLSVPEGTFIFSDAKDLAIKDENTLKIFGLSPKKQGYTPAEIAKRYDTNKYKAIIEDPASDEIRKATAQLMVKSYFKKLAQLALIQEQMKGFPQGIPEMAKRYLPELQGMEEQTPQPSGGQESSDMQENPEAQEQGQMMQQQGPQEEMMEGPQDQNPEEEQQEEMPPNMQMPQQKWGGSYNYGGDVFDNGGSYYYAGGGYFSSNVSTMPGQVVGQTVVTKTKAPLTDKDYTEFLTLLTTLDPRRKRSGNNYRISSIPPDKIDRFIELVNKFGFSRGPESGKPGHNIKQGATPGYSYQTKVGGKDKTQGFFTGFTPMQFEKKLLVDLLGSEAAYDKLTPEQRTKMYFDELGIDENSYTSKGLSLSDPKKLYTNKEFFENTFYPAFAKNFTGADFRDLGDDMQLGMDHYDSYMRRVKTSTTTTAPAKAVAYVCNNGNVEVYDATKHGAGVATYPSYQEAQKNCVNDPNQFIPPAQRPPFKTRPFKTDVMNLGLAALVPPNKYYPWMAKLPFEPTDVAFKDWRAKAAERQSLYGKMANQLNQYSPGSATASNLSFLAGQQAEGLIGDIDKVDTENVAIANAYAQSEQARKDKVMAANVGARDEYIDQLNTLNQNYDNALRGYYNTIGQAATTLSENQLKALLINASQNGYQFDPWTSQTIFTGGKGWGDLGTASGGDWKSLGDDYRSAQQEIPGITPDVWRQIKFGKQTAGAKYGGRVGKSSMTDIAKMLQGGYTFPF